MSGSEVLLFLHVVGAIVWVGAGLTGQLVEAWLHRHHEWQLLARLQPAWASIETPAIVLGPVLLLGSGIGLVLDGPFGFGDTWVALGLGGYLAALALGGIFQAPGIRRLHAVAGERGPDDPEAVALARRLHALMWPELAILAVVLLAMTTKPTGAGSAAFWAVVAALLGGAGLVAGRAHRATQRAVRGTAAAPEG